MLGDADAKLTLFSGWCLMSTFICRERLDSVLLWRASRCSKLIKYLSDISTQGNLTYVELFSKGIASQRTGRLNQLC